MKSCLRLWAVGLLVAWAGLAQAQVPDRVGRVAYLSGEVQFYSDSTGAWEPAQLNAPVTSHNSLFAGAGSRAEIRFGSTALALDSQSQLNIHLLDDDDFRASISQGSISLRSRHFDRNEVMEVMAPGANYRVLQDGRYRVDAGEGGSSVTVFAGAVNATVAGGSVLVEAGKTLTTSGGGYLLLPARNSALDAWALQRDEAYRPGVSARYVSPYMTGYEDLDANGRWENDPDYGMVWFPTTYVEVGWVPYRHGHWAHVPPWGWTWVDDAPWGFAPFHYGRWVQVGSAWGWTPGGYVTHPSYVPALVAFVGIGGVPTARGAPPVGWYPLPPWERYRPTYTQNAAYLRNINNFSNVNPPPRAWSQVGGGRVTNNQLHGMTLVPQGDFVGSRPVARSMLSVPASVLPTAAPVAAPTAPPLRPRSAEGATFRGPGAGAPESGRRPPEGGSARQLPSPSPRRDEPAAGAHPDASRSLGGSPSAPPPGASSPNREGATMPRVDGAFSHPVSPPVVPPARPEERRAPVYSPRESGVPGVPSAPGVGVPSPRPRPEREEAPDRFPGRGPSRGESPAPHPAVQPMAPAAPLLERPVQTAPQRDGGFREGAMQQAPRSQPPVGEMPRPQAFPAPRPEPMREVGREPVREPAREPARERGGEASPRPHGGDPERDSRRFGGADR